MISLAAKLTLQRKIPLHVALAYLFIYLLISMGFWGERVVLVT